MILRITKYGEPILNTKGKPIKHFDEKLRKLAYDMLETMHEAEGIGIAAQQVNEALQLFVVDIEDCDDNYVYDGRRPPIDLIMPIFACNPVIEAVSESTLLSNEGCLSFPGIQLDDIERPAEIKMRFQDLDGATHTLVCDGLLARCCQHEYDHLQGILFSKKANKESLERENENIRILKKSSEDFLKQSASS